MTTWKKVESGLNVERTFPEKDRILGVGDSAEGRYVEKLENIGENNSTVYVLENEAKMRIGVWGSAVLESKFKRIAFGKMVKVVFLGDEPSMKRKGKTYKNWDVFEGIDTIGDEKGNPF